MGDADEVMGKAEAAPIKDEPEAEEEAPAAKKQRTEEPANETAAPDAAVADEGEPVAEGVPAEAAEPEGGTEAAEAKAQGASGPTKIGYKSFQSGGDALKYYQNLISKLRKDQNLNEYEFHMVMELIRLGHPDAERKLGGGVRAVQVRETNHGGNRTTCFFLIHDNNKAEDVSYRKCIAKLFPEMSDLTSNYNRASPRQQSGGGRGRGGRGGRGRGRGRGRH
ncbi:hypothetical protein N2152v2_004451 [Parachlorella kessleri]